MTQDDHHMTVAITTERTWRHNGTGLISNVWILHSFATRSSFVNMNDIMMGCRQSPRMVEIYNRG